MCDIRVVVADDHSFIRNSMIRLLNQNNICVVAEAKDGVEAIHQVDQQVPDILLLDLEMPVLNGIEVARQLLSGSTGLKIIVISNYTDRILVEEMLALGLHGYLSKDVVVKCLVATVEAVYLAQEDFVPIVALEPA